MSTSRCCARRSSALGGREVKNTGDGLMVAFGSASAAVRCAVAMQQLFERRYRRAEQAVAHSDRVGCGRVDGAWTAIISGCRRSRRRGCVTRHLRTGFVVSSLVKALAGRVEGLVFESVGELELKGFAEPVEAFAVPWVALGEEAGSAGCLAVAGGAAVGAAVLAYVGREAERARNRGGA